MGGICGFFYFLAFGWEREAWWGGRAVVGGIADGVGRPPCRPRGLGKVVASDFTAMTRCRKFFDANRDIRFCGSSASTAATAIIVAAARLISRDIITPYLLGFHRRRVSTCVVDAGARHCGYQIGN